MLTRIELQSFRSLSHVELNMAGLTVLIGPNGGGKSNFLDALLLMKEAASGKLSEGIAKRGGGDVLGFRGKPEAFRGGFDFQFAEEHIYYKVVLSPRPSPRVRLEQAALTPISLSSLETLADGLLSRGAGNLAKFLNATSKQEDTKDIKDPHELALFQVKDQTAYPVPYEILQQFENWAFYQPIPVEITAPIRGPQTLRSGLRLFSDGSNLASVLYAIQSQHPVIWEEMLEVLKTAHPGFHHLSFPAEGGDGRILLRWWESPFDKDYGFSANLLSDGTLRFLSLLAILKTPDPPPLICIDEPEIGLHPDWIRLVAELLESAATRTQVIVSTHSPELVSYIHPEHVVVVEKEYGETTLSRLSSAEMAGWLDKFRLGDLWLAGHIGGRP